MASTCEPESQTVLLCSSPGDWHTRESLANATCKGFRVRRPVCPDRFQHLVDSQVARDAESLEKLDVAVEVSQSQLQAGSANLKMTFEHAASQLLGKATSFGLTPDLAAMIREDVPSVGMGLAALVPGAKGVVVKLEMMASFLSCPQWHQDHFVARAIVTYNSCGTQYKDNMDECHDAHIYSVDVGDILLIKGREYNKSCPDSALWHRSPPARYQPCGREKYRLCLKLDVIGPVIDVDGVAPQTPKAPKRKSAADWVDGTPPKSLRSPWTALASAGKMLRIGA